AETLGFSPSRAASTHVAEAVSVEPARIGPFREQTQRRAGTLEQRLELGRPRRDVERLDDRRGDFHDPEREALREAERRLEVSDAVAPCLEARELRRGRERVVEIAERVDEPALARRLPRPHSAARDR